MSENKGLKLNVSFTDLDVFQDIVRILAEAVVDERIDEDVRNNYIAKINSIMEANDMYPIDHGANEEQARELGYKSSGNEVRIVAKE